MMIWKFTIGVRHMSDVARFMKEIKNFKVWVTYVDKFSHSADFLRSRWQQRLTPIFLYSNRMSRRRGNEL